MAIIVADSPPVNRPRLRLIQDEESVPYDTGPPPREPFSMMPRWVAEEHAAKLGLAAWGVLTMLVHHADADGRCFPSRKRIADLLGIHPNTVTEAIAKLTAAGLVTVESRRTETGSQTSNGYVLPFLCPTSRTEGGSVVDVAPLNLGRTPPTSRTEPVNENHVNENESNENGEYPPTPRRKPTYPDDFEAFWLAYPSGHGTKKVAADRWRRLDRDDRAAAVEGLHAWCASDQWTKDGGRFIPYAEKYLGNRVWENVPPPPVPPAPSPNGYHRDDNRLYLGDLLRQIEDDQRRMT